MDIANIINIPVVPALDFKLPGGSNAVKAVGTDTESFESFLQAFTDIYKETGENIQVAQDRQLDFALGKTDDLVGLTLALEKASSSLNFTVQVTNKILESYKEIMRLQM